MVDNWKGALKPYAFILAGIQADLQSISDDELVELNDSLAEPEKVVCWEFLQRAATYLKPLVEAELKRREILLAEYNKKLLAAG